MDGETHFSICLTWAKYSAGILTQTWPCSPGEKRNSCSGATREGRSTEHEQIKGSLCDMLSTFKPLQVAEGLDSAEDAVMGWHSVSAWVGSWWIVTEIN